MMIIYKDIAIFIPKSLTIKRITQYTYLFFLTYRETYQYVEHY